MSQKKDNSGVLFKNSRKKFKPADPKNPKAAREPLDDDEARKPDSTGEAKIDGRDYYVAGWKKESKAQGQPYLSLAFTLKNSADIAP